MFIKKKIELHIVLQKKNWYLRIYYIFGSPTSLKMLQKSVMKTIVFLVSMAFVRFHLYNLLS